MHLTDALPDEGEAMRHELERRVGPRDVFDVGEVLRRSGDAHELVLRDLVLSGQLVGMGPQHAADRVVRVVDRDVVDLRAEDVQGGLRVAADEGHVRRGEPVVGVDL